MASPGRSRLPAPRLRGGQPCRAGPFRHAPPGVGEVPAGQGALHAPLQGHAHGLPAGPGRPDHDRRGQADDLAGRPDAGVHPRGLGALAGDHADLSEGGEDPLLLRSLRLSPGDHRSLRDRRGPGLRVGQAVLRRDHDAFPGQYREAPGAPQGLSD